MPLGEQLRFPSRDVPETNATLTPRPTSLVATEQHTNAKKLVTSEFSKTMEWKQSPRPCYDMVEEYNRSLDEYKDKVRGIITEIHDA